MFLCLDFSVSVKPTVGIWFGLDIHVLNKTIISMIYIESLHADISKASRKTAITILTSHISVEMIYSPIPIPLPTLYLIG